MTVQTEEALTPEEKNTIARLNAEIDDAPVVYEWYYRHKMPLRWLMPLLVFVFFYGLALFLCLDGHSFYDVTPFVTVGTVMPLVFYFLFSPDTDYYYQITPLGLRVRYKDRIHDAVFTVIRGSAWVGIAVCVIAAMTLGPMAFVGAGGFALMGFSKTNTRNVEKSYNHLFDLEHNYYIQYSHGIKRKSMFCPTLKHKFWLPYAVTFRYEDEQLEEIYEQLKRYIKIKGEYSKEFVSEQNNEAS